jgi:hypothetical protein
VTDLRGILFFLPPRQLIRGRPTEGRSVDNELSVVNDFVHSNRKAMASYVRQKLIAAGAKQYLESLRKEGIESLDNEAAGVLLELACALFRRWHPEREI